MNPNTMLARLQWKLIASCNPWQWLWCALHWQFERFLRRGFAEPAAYARAKRSIRLLRRSIDDWCSDADCSADALFHKATTHRLDKEIDRIYYDCAANRGLTEQGV